MKVGDIITVQIRRYRDVDDKGIGLTEKGNVVIVSDMGEPLEIVTAKITRLLEKTILAVREEDDDDINDSKLLDKGSSKKQKGVYELDDGDDDDDDYMDDEDLDDEY